MSFCVFAGVVSDSLAGILKLLLYVKLGFFLRKKKRFLAQRIKLVIVLKPVCKAVGYKNMERCMLRVVFLLVEKIHFYLKSIFICGPDLMYSLPDIGGSDGDLNTST